MDSSNNLNEHHIWDRQYFQNAQNASPRNTSENNQATLVPSRLRPSSQSGFIASNSDNLFHPVPGATSSCIFTLPNIPFNPNPHYQSYNQRVNTPLRQSLHILLLIITPHFQFLPLTLIIRLLLHQEYHHKFLHMFTLNQYMSIFNCITQVITHFCSL